MPEFLSPDVVVEEVQGKNGQIPTPSTSTFAIVGYSPRGPEGKPFLHGSFLEFSQRFGSFSSKSMNAYAAAAFFLNGGSRLVFVREMHSDATYATGAFPGTWDVKASGRGEWGNGAEITLSGNPNFYTRATATYSRFDVTVEVINASTGLLEVAEVHEAVELSDEEDPDYILKILEANSENVIFTAVSGGVPAELQPVPHTGLVLGTGNGSQTTFTAVYGAEAPVGEQTVKVKVNGVQVAEDDGDGNLIAVSGGPTISGTVNYETGSLSVTISPAPAAALPLTVDLITKPNASVTVTLATGTDGSAVESSDIVGAGLAANNRGIFALNLMDEQLQIAIPDFAGDQATSSSLIAYCAGRLDCLAIIEPPKGSSSAAAANYKRNVLASTSSYAAMYWPWVKIPDPLNRNRAKVIPPCGHMAGRMAYTDQAENVGKAPAGVIRGQLQWILGLERDLTKTDRDTVYQAQINPIRSDANVGTAIFGNKTLQPVGDFTDVNIRRLFIFLRRSQQAGLLDILFENIGPVTFGLIKARLDAFLETLFLGGVIGSGVPDKNQAFKVVVDESNNPPSIQQQKRIIIDEFIKPNLAAEYIHLRLQRVFDATQV